MIRELKILLGAERCRDDSAVRLSYASDNSRRFHPPDAVVFPHSEEEVARIVVLANKHRTPLVARGRGTGTAGGALAEQGGVVVSLENMRAIKEVSDDFAVAEPGALNGEVQQACARRGLFWPPDPSSYAYCSIGGNIAANAAGPRAVKYGAARDNTVALRAVCGDGVVIRTGARAVKNAAGFDLTRLIAGSEGTLAIITEATLKLLPLPPHRAGIVAEFPAAAQALAAAARLRATSRRPAAIEFMDRGALELIRGKHPELADPQTGAMLLLALDAEREAELPTDDVVGICRTEGARVVRAGADDAQLWGVRRALSPLLRAAAAGKINEDIAVPPSRLAAFVGRVEEIAARADLLMINFGHAGDGNLHFNILFNSEAEKRRAGEALAEIFAAAADCGGTISAEHGIGIAKRAFISYQLDAPTLALMRRVKQAFDPNNILNPGKIFPA